MLLDAIFFVRISRHGLCPLFSSARKRTRPPAVVGAEEGRRRVRRFGLRSGRWPGQRKRFSCAFPKVMDGGGGGASAVDGAAVCQDDYYIRFFDLLVMDPMFHAVFHACRPGRSLESDDREQARRKRHKIMHDSLFPSHLRLCPCVRWLFGVAASIPGPKATAWAVDPQYILNRGAFILPCGRRRAAKACTIRKSNMNPKNIGSYKEGEGGRRRQGKACSSSGKGQKGEGAYCRQKKKELMEN